MTRERRVCGGLRVERKEDVAVSEWRKMGMRQAQSREKRVCCWLREEAEEYEEGLEQREKGTYVADLEQREGTGCGTLKIQREEV